MLAPFDYGGRLPSRWIAARCNIILDRHRLWSVALGADRAAVEDMGRVAGEVVAAIDHIACRDRRADWSYSWPDVGHCALCWRLVPRGGERSGFRDKTVMPGGRRTAPMRPSFATHGSREV